MACAAVAALHFFLWRNYNPYSSENASPAFLWAMWFTIDVIRQCLISVGLTGTIFSFFWYVRGYAAFAQPGQWLLLTCVFSAMELYWKVLYQWILGPDLNNAATNLQAVGILSWAFILVSMAIYFGPVPIYGWCAWKISDTLPWRFTFACLALEVLFIHLSLLLFQHYGYTTYASVAIPALAANGTVILFEIWSAKDDLLSDRSRFWTHWVGISLSITGRVLKFVGVSVNLLR